MILLFKIAITLGFIALIAATELSCVITNKAGDRIRWLEILGNFFLANVIGILFVWEVWL